MGNEEFTLLIINKTLNKSLNHLLIGHRGIWLLKLATCFISVSYGYATSSPSYFLLLLLFWGLQVF